MCGCNINLLKYELFFLTALVYTTSRNIEVPPGTDSRVFPQIRIQSNGMSISPFPPFKESRREAEITPGAAKVETTVEQN